jgi:hypothetical protein
LICKLLNEGPECYLLTTNTLTAAPAHTTLIGDMSSGSGMTMAQVNAIFAEERRAFDFTADVDMSVDINDDGADEVYHPECKDPPDVCELRRLIQRALRRCLLCYYCL